MSIFGSNLYGEGVYSTAQPQGALGGGAIAAAAVSDANSTLGTDAGTNPGLAPQPDATMQIVQLAAEVLEQQDSAIQVSQLAAEILNTKEPALQVSGIFMEVLRSADAFLHPVQPNDRTHRIR
jgi:hypothetical protein